MKPFGTFKFLMMVIGVLLVIAWSFPHKINLGSGYSLKFPDLNSFFADSSIQYKNIAPDIVQLENRINSSQQKQKSITDTLDIDSIINVIQKIEFYDSMHSSLDTFFVNLRNNNCLFHVLHYGDSQIEGDRITGFLRNRFQKRFGGSGAGLLSLIPPANIDGAAIIKNNGNWKRYTLFGNTNKTIHHNAYGVLLSFSRFAPVYNDSISTDTTMYKSSIELIKNPSASEGNFNFNTLTLLYGNNKKPVFVELKDEDKLLGYETLVPSDHLKTAQWKLNHVPEKISIHFSGNDSPDIYALSLENTAGVEFDNIPLRGSSGVDFTRSNLTLLKESFDALRVKLLIYEFGVNVVPNIQDDYAFYENWIYKQLSSLKQIHPDMAILVIGTSDMSQKTDLGMESYPNIEKIRNAQKRAAFNAHCAFWDLYSAMGGKNSMPSWVQTNPPMAASDYTHLSPRGARIVGEMLYNALLYEYNEYKKKNPLPVM
jgi:lysophospholipase L1-like esterase